MNRIVVEYFRDAREPPETPLDRVRPPLIVAWQRSGQPPCSTSARLASPYASHC